MLIEARRALAATLLLCVAIPAWAQNQRSVAPLATSTSIAPAPPPAPVAGDLVVSGFSGVRAPDPRQLPPAGKTVNDLTFLDTAGDAAKIVGLAGAGVYRDSRQVQLTPKFSVKAGQVGQIFGVAIGDQPLPTTYLAATSVFGLQIVRKLPNGSFERLRRGGAGAQWAEGQFGTALQGGPGSIYAVDGETGDVRLLTNVVLNGVPNPGPGLGNIAFDARNHQLFATDLYTGMIHRIGLDGSDLGSFDHGVDGRAAAGLNSVEFDPRVRLNIANNAFDVDNPETWGFAPEARRVWAVAVHQDRLFYSVQEGPRIWSVGIQEDGSLARDVRLEVEAPASPGPYAVTDIAFSPRGAMVLAQRAPFGNGFYDYSAFTKPAEPRVLRFWLKTPQDPPGAGLWKPEPEEVSVGFASTYRNANGGVTFGYGFDRRGEPDFNACGASLIATGEKLRLNEGLRKRLEPGGALPVDGLQIGFADAIRRPDALEPWPSNFWDYDGVVKPETSSGRMGGVRAVEAPCQPALAGLSGGFGAASGGAGSPPYVYGPHNPPGDPTCYGAQCTDCPQGLSGNVPCGPTGSTVDLAIKKTGATSPPANVNAYSFTLAVDNLGPAFTPPPNTVVVSDTPPPGMSFSSITVTPAGWTCSSLSPGVNPFTCVWNGGALPTGPIATITIVANALPSVPPPYPPFTNCASVSVDPSSGFQDIDPSNNQDCVTVSKPGGHDVAIKKSGVLQQGPALTGYSFTLATTNVGDGFTGAGLVTVTDVVPPGMSFTITATTGAPNWNCGAPGTLAAGATLTCSFIGTGPAGPGATIGTITITATYTGTAPVENCATVAVSPGAFQDQNPSNDKGCITLTPPGTSTVVDVSLAKTFTAGSDPSKGDFTLKVHNEGGDLAAGTTISISDQVPAGVTITGLGGGSSSNWNCGAMPVTGAATLNCTYTGTGSFAAGGNLPDLTLTSTLASAGSEVGIYRNCGTVALANSSGPITETNTANNTSCAVTNTINPQGCTLGSPGCPKPAAVCSQDVLIVVDNSVSIPNIGAVRTALTSFLQAMKDKGGKVDIHTFNNKANWANITAGWTPVTSGTIGTLNSQIGTIVTGGTRTNWDDALERTFNIVSGHNPKPLVIFITDGEPTAYNNTSGVEVDASTMPVTASQEAVTWINQIRAAGSPLIALGFGPVSTSGYLDAAFGGPSGGPSNVDLENTSVIKMGSVYDLNGVMSTLANQMCGLLSLNKSVANPYRSHMIATGATSVNVSDVFNFTLVLTNNSSAPIAGIAVQDQVPAVLTSVTAGSASAGSATVAGNLVTWSGITLGAHQSATATFSGAFNKTYTAPANEQYSNYAQVTAATNYTATALNNMNPTNGPVTEVDESRADFSEYIYKQPPDLCAGANPPDSCFIGVFKNRTNPGAEDNSCTSSPAGGPANPCPFTINVTLTNIPPGSTVTVSDQLTLNGTSETWPGTVQSNICSGSAPTNVSFSCAHTGLTSFNGGVTVQIPPGQSGLLKNCVTVTVTNNTTNPPFHVSATSCANVTLSQPAGLVSCPNGQRPDAAKGCAPDPRCASPLVFNPATKACSCPVGTTLRGRACVTDGVVCRPPLVPNAVGKCDCPAGSTLRDGKCVGGPPVCKQPFVLNAAGVCACPAGLTQRGGECVKTDVCRAPMQRNADGGCDCPVGTTLRNGKCVANPPACKPPLTLNAAGVCACPVGTTLRAGKCVAPIVCKPPMRPDARGISCVCAAGTVRRGNQCVDVSKPVCRPPARLGPRGACECPPEYVARGAACVPREKQRPLISPDTILRAVPGLLLNGRGGVSGPGNAVGTGRK